jgi:protein tyrosine phosphatase
LKVIPSFHEQHLDVFGHALENLCASNVDRWTPDKALALCFCYKQVILPMRDVIRTQRMTEINNALAQRINIDNLRAQLDKLQALLRSDDCDTMSLQLHDQFFLLENPSYSAFIGRLDENLGRNRFSDIVPFDATRVPLTPCKANNHNDYINASFVHMERSNPANYIAAQGPMGPITAALFVAVFSFFFLFFFLFFFYCFLLFFCGEVVTDPTYLFLLSFWQMIWERDVQVVAMLCNEDGSSDEQEPSSCFVYWPEEVSVTLVWRACPCGGCLVFCCPILF